MCVIYSGSTPRTLLRARCAGRCSRYRFLFVSSPVFSLPPPASPTILLLHLLQSRKLYLLLQAESNKTIECISTSLSTFSLLPSQRQPGTSRANQHPPGHLHPVHTSPRSRHTKKSEFTVRSNDHPLAGFQKEIGRSLGEKSFRVRGNVVTRDRARGSEDQGVKRREAKIRSKARFPAVCCVVPSWVLGFWSMEPDADVSGSGTVVG